MNRPVPTPLKLLRGNPGKRPINDDEPQPEVGADMPPDLSPKAREVWGRVAPQLERAQVLTQMDAAALAAFCEAYAVWREATDHIHGRKKGDGLVTRTALGFYVQSPYLSIAARAHDQMVGLLREFGMTPSSRTRVKAVGRKKTNRFASIAGGKQE